MPMFLVKNSAKMLGQKMSPSDLLLLQPCFDETAPVQCRVLAGSVGISAPDPLQSSHVLLLLNVFIVFFAESAVVTSQ